MIAQAKKVFFSSLFAVLVGGFIPITIACYYQLSRPLDSTYGERLGVRMAKLAFFLLYVFLPIALVIVLYVPKEKLQDPTFKQLFGALYGNVKTENRF